MCRALVWPPLRSSRWWQAVAGVAERAGRAGVCRARSTPAGRSTGSGAVTTISDGTDSAATMHLQRRRPRRPVWNVRFTATATAAGTDQGALHLAGPARVVQRDRAPADMIVNGKSSPRRLSTPGRQSCCTTPSNGFLYGGVATFDVQAGDTYGFHPQRHQRRHQPLPPRHLHAEHQALPRRDDRDRQPPLARVPRTCPPGHCPRVARPGPSTRPARPAGSSSRSCPGQQVSVTLKNLPADYDLALYGDIEKAFDALSNGDDVAQLAAAAAAGAPGSEPQVPTYPTDVTTVPTSADNAAVDDVRAADLCAADLCAADLCAADLCAADLCAADLRAAHLRAGLLRPRPRVRRRVPRRLHGGAEPDAAGRVDEHRHGRTRQ